MQQAKPHSVDVNRDLCVGIIIVRASQGQRSSRLPHQQFLKLLLSRLLAGYKPSYSWLAKAKL